jgi:hypothetical protein
MAARRVTYVDLHVPRRAGAAAKVLEAIADADINLLAFTGFPEPGGKDQVDLVTDDIAAVRRVARKQGWSLGPNKRGFLIQGPDSVGAVYRELRRLARSGINVTAADAVVAGKGRYGMILWVKPRDYARAARVLHVR